MKRIIGFAVGILYLVIASGAYRKSASGWDAGHADLGFWWMIIALLLTIAALGALIGTWIHTRAPQ